MSPNSHAAKTPGARKSISRNLLTRLSKHYQTEGLAQPSKKSGGRRSNTRSLKYQDTEAVKKFICHYAEDHAVSLPGRLPGFKREDIRLLPSAIPKSGIYRQYADHANQAGLRVVGASTFRQLWLELCPYIVMAKPMTDLCWRCQRNNGRIFRGTFITDEEKNDLILEQQRHLSQVNGERQLYQQMTAEAKEVVQQHGLQRLQPSQPEIYKAFKDGNFSVQLIESNPFVRIPVDQTTEITVNRDTQTVGGTTKFSLKSGAVSKYYLTAEYRSAFLTKLRNMVQHNRRGTDHLDLQKSRLQKDEELVTSVEETLANWANPFKCNTDLMNIASGTIASKEIAEDLKNAHTMGETDYATFKRERLESDEPTKKFHDPMKKASLKTFGSAAK
ncbi:hypothetical protein ACOMHN_018943 [Nucella lapillus]